MASSTLHPVIAELKALRLQELSPLDAFDALRRLKASVDAAEPA